MKRHTFAGGADFQPQRLTVFVQMKRAKLKSYRTIPGNGIYRTRQGVIGSFVQDIYAAFSTTV